MRKLTFALSALLVLVFGGCAEKAFQPYQTTLTASKNISEEQKQEALTNFISKEKSYTSRLDNNCLKYSYNSHSFIGHYKYCYKLENNIIKKENLNDCSFLGTRLDRTQKWVKMEECYNEIEEVRKFHTKVKNLENKLQTKFPEYLKTYENNLEEIEKNRTLAKSTTNKRESVKYFEKACNLGSYKSCRSAYAIKKQIEEEYRAIREAEKKAKDLEQKALLEKQRVAKIKALRDRKGQHTITVLDSYNYKYALFKGSCEKGCVDYTKDNNGYLTLQEALDDGWKFKSKISSTSNRLNSDCVCENSTYVLER